MKFFRKHRVLITRILAFLLVLAMIIPMFLSYIV